MNPTIKFLQTLIEGARLLGLSVQDLNTAQEFIEHHEFGLCFDTILTQMFENDIEINENFYGLITKIAYKMELPTEGYSFMKDLVRSDNNIPKNVREQLGIIMNSLTT